MSPSGSRLRLCRMSLTMASILSGALPPTLRFAGPSPRSSARALFGASSATRPIASTPPALSVSITLRNSWAFTPASMRRNTCFVWRETSAWRARSPSTLIGTISSLPSGPIATRLSLRYDSGSVTYTGSALIGLTSSCDRQLNLQPTLHHRCRHHEDDQQHDDPMDRRAAAVLKEHGYRYADHKARRITEIEIESADLVVAMEDVHLRRVLELAPDRSRVSLLTEFDPTAVPGSGVPDPWFGSDSGFHDTLTAIEAAMPGLLDRIRELQDP